MYNKRDKNNNRYFSFTFMGLKIMVCYYPNKNDVVVVLPSNDAFGTVNYSAYIGTSGVETFKRRMYYWHFIRGRVELNRKRSANYDDTRHGPEFDSNIKH